MDIINLLPDSIANQIAAGEVIQRPMSVVKELMENSIDAKAKNIIVNIWDAGKTEIQIIDDGLGMSESDARLSIERHATSKIKSTEDLFSINTMGFRGEALASIASITHLEIKTKRESDELGTNIKVEGSKVISQEPINCDTGSNFSVKNLFFNVPARRNFLKSNNAELKHITMIFLRIVLCYPEVSFKMFSNGKLLFNLPKSNLKQRIVSAQGSHINSKLVNIQTETSIVDIQGYILKPENAKKAYGEQFFFVNNRYMKHPFFHKAIMNAFDRLLKPNTIPSYYIYLTTDPKNIDINVHPTKTEIKFRDDQSIFQILQATVKESLGKFNLGDVIDFEEDNSVKIPILTKETEVTTPIVEIDNSYNPFNTSQTSQIQSPIPTPAPITRAAPSKVNTYSNAPRQSKITNDWEELYSGFEKEAEVKTEIIKSTTVKSRLFNNSNSYDNPSKFIQLKNRYILTTVKSGLMVIDIKRANERILFEQLLKSKDIRQWSTQNLLFPEVISLSNIEFENILNIIPNLNSIGFNIKALENNSIEITGIPPQIKESEIKSIISQFIERIDIVEDLEMISLEFIAENISKFSNNLTKHSLNEDEMKDIFNKLFTCQNPNYTSNGRLIIKIINSEDLIREF